MDPEETLQNNRSMAESRLRMLKRKFESNPKLAADYTATVEAYIADKQAILVEADELNTQYEWYLPHHAVFKKSNPEKCRVVFDCAAQFKGISIQRRNFARPELPQQFVGCADAISEGTGGGDWGHQTHVPPMFCVAQGQEISSLSLVAGWRHYH